MPEPTFALTWDAPGEHLYETGVDRGVLYTPKTTTTSDGSTTDPYGTATAWNGLTAVTESPSGAEATALYADNIKYLNLISAEDFGGTIEAYTYPDEFNACQGLETLATGAVIAQQTHVPFGFAYRTVLGNDSQNNNYGYKLHLWYGCTAAPSEKAYATINDSPEAITFSWEVSTVTTPVANHKPTACITVDSTKATAAGLAALEAVLYGTTGTSGTDGRLPLPDEVATLLATT